MLKLIVSLVAVMTSAISIAQARFANYAETNRGLVCSQERSATETVRSMNGWFAGKGENYVLVQTQLGARQVQADYILESYLGVVDGKSTSCLLVANKSTNHGAVSKPYFSKRFANVPTAAKGVSCTNETNFENAIRQFNSWFDINGTVSNYVLVDTNIGARQVFATTIKNVTIQTIGSVSQICAIVEE